ncbi:MULE transposase domain [Popillia japonica]|uniref:MULE transposase domain n=1 Tax=Popillia japonica TaxID=7064 RepID=A0AAW1JX56_POPJA
MQRCEHWYADGTFKTNPLLFAQMYTIHAVQYSNVIPTVYALLPNKTEYNRLFSALKNLQPGLQPTSVLVDFEKAAMNASQTQFPNAKIRGRFFTLHNVFGDRFKSMAYKAFQMQKYAAVSSLYTMSLATDSKAWLTKQILNGFHFCPTTDKAICSCFCSGRCRGSLSRINGQSIFYGE